MIVSKFFMLLSYCLFSLSTVQTVPLLSLQWISLELHGHLQLALVEIIPIRDLVN